MNETIDYYNKNADRFVADTINADMSDLRNRFLSFIKPGGSILDAGCGSGRDAFAFLQEGFDVKAFDASEEMCRRASYLLGTTVECKRFEDLSGENQFDGIWASASLLHLNENDLVDVMCKLKELLKPKGILYASFKEGESDRIKDGRFFHDMTEERCRALFQKAGVNVLEVIISQDVRPDRACERWVNIIGEKGE